ncbi:MAG: DUF2281 domain-containing protein [Cyanobacteria bacterium]|nr:DUF2281 domain-containing protein [Cyanobacteriota bacterium]MDA0867509.1 DUF2281 domain-containing protein [Cyanobacteriota bacterium]
MSTADTIYELVKTLPEEQASLVLVFVEFLRQRFRSISPEHPQALSHYFGVLQDSPNFNEDPIEIQRAMRSEWE